VAAQRGNIFIISPQNARGGAALAAWRKQRRKRHPQLFVNAGEATANGAAKAIN